MKKKNKKPIEPISKSSMEQMRKRFISTCTPLEKFLILTYVAMFKVKDGNYYKTDKDYSFWIKLNPFHPISYLLILFMILRGIFTKELDYNNFLSNLKSVFTWEEEEL